MNRSLLIAASLSAVLLNAMTAIAHDDHAAGQAQMHDTPTAVEEHAHGTLEVPVDRPVPTVNLVIHPDAHRGWNLEIQLTNFAFAPERVNQTSIPTEGHAHLYVDRVKLTRLYGNWYYLESLPPGRHEITVSLNANGHEALMYNDQPIESTVAIEVSR